MNEYLLLAMASLLCTMGTASGPKEEALEDYVKDPAPSNKCFQKFEGYLESVGYRYVGWEKILNIRLMQKLG